ncbi:MAG: hypothetical protein MI921_04700 [Cytophagales bacterium]|nr:hypothetical protein [Cytophagales bacterium]
MKPEITKTNQQEPNIESQGREALIFGAALKTRCGYRLLKMIRERNKNDCKTDKNSKL